VGSGTKRRPRYKETVEDPASCGCETDLYVSAAPHPASRIPHPASRIPHPASRIPHPASRIPHPAPRIPRPAPRGPRLRFPASCGRVELLAAVVDLRRVVQIL
jgi:hypothetical protein